jgi:hypothetical protein
LIKGEGVDDLSTAGLGDRGGWRPRGRCCAAGRRSWSTASDVAATVAVLIAHQSQRARPADFAAEPAVLAARFAVVLASEPASFAAFFLRVAAAFFAASDRCSFVC